MIVLSIGLAFFVVVLSVLAVVAMKMGIPLSELFGDGKKSGGGVDLKAYEARALVSPAELSFYQVLREVVRHPSDPHGADQAVVLCKVRAADLVGVKKGLERSKYQSAFNRIKAKHVDFVLARATDLSVLCVVELDDSTHRQKKVQERDALMDAIYGATGIAVVHVPCKKVYVKEEVAGLIRGALGGGEPA